MLDVAEDDIAFADGLFVDAARATGGSRCSTSRAPSPSCRTCPTICARRSARRRPSPAASRPIRPAPRCARSRSIPTPARSTSAATPRSTTAARRSTRSSCTARCTAASRTASARRCWRRWSGSRAPGQMLSASFLDYAMPRADHFPHMDIDLTEDPYRGKGNELRVKGGGEAGITPSPAALINAVIDALAGHRHRAHRHAGDAAAAVGRAQRRPRSPVRRALTARLRSGAVFGPPVLDQTEAAQRQARPHRGAEIERHPGDLILPVSEVVGDRPSACSRHAGPRACRAAPCRSRRSACQRPKYIGTSMVTRKAR